MLNAALTVLPQRRGGRPPREQAGMLDTLILDVAAELFFSEGYGAASIEEIARRAHISKRTFYARYKNKEAVFAAVVYRVVLGLRPDGEATDHLFAGKDIASNLAQIGRIFLQGALAPQALALHRILQAEAARFPELASIVSEQGARREAISRLSAMFMDHRRLDIKQAEFMAEQFLFMMTAGPQRRALGLGEALDDRGREEWLTRTVSLFLNGYLIRPTVP